MKAFITLLLVVASLAAYATEEFTLKFKDRSSIVNNENDWVFVAEENNIYKLYVSKDAIGSGNNQTQIHTKVEYNEQDGYKFEALNQPIKRIFTLGIIDCQNAIFYMVTDFFVDSSNKIVHFQQHELGEYRVEMLTPNTTRNSLYKVVCNIK